LQALDPKKSREPTARRKRFDEPQVEANSRGRPCSGRRALDEMTLNVEFLVERSLHDMVQVARSAVVCDARGRALSPTPRALPTGVQAAKQPALGRGL
jgi:hypothetical protein